VRLHPFVEATKRGVSTNSRISILHHHSSLLNFRCFRNGIDRPCLVHRDYVCNETIHCINMTMCDAGCASHYRCQNGQCMKRSTICDKSVCASSCPEDDGWETGIGFKCTRNGQTCRLPQQLLWDNVKDCDDGSDICYQSNISVSDGR